MMHSQWNSGTTRLNEDDSESQDASSDEEMPRSQRKRSTSRRSACVHCKSLKVRCEFLPDQKICRRCKLGNYECLARQRKKRKAAPTHEDLRARAIDQDAQIQQLLQKLDDVKQEHKITSWISNPTSSSLKGFPRDQDSKTNVQSKWMKAGTKADAAAVAYFGPGQSVLSCPNIIRHCSIYPEEIVALFDIYFNRINPFFPLLDPELHTAGRLIWTNPFLFTVICATSLRYYSSRPDLGEVAAKFAQNAARHAILEPHKSVEICQAYLILSAYPISTKRWIEDRSSMLMDVAVRMALELELNQPPSSSISPRDAYNRIRTWLVLFWVDGAHSLQSGKPPMIRHDDYLARNSREWYHSSNLNLPYDVHLSGQVQLILIVAKWRKDVDTELDVPQLALVTSRRLFDEMDAWAEKYVEAHAYKPFPIYAYQSNTSYMITAYFRLAILSHALQRTVHGTLTHDSTLLLQALDAAREVIQIAMERLFPTKNLRYATDGIFGHISFAAGFLLTLLGPAYRSLLDHATQQEILFLVGQATTLLGSDIVAVDFQHSPAVHSRFLQRLLAQYANDVASPKYQQYQPTSWSATTQVNPSNQHGGTFVTQPNTADLNLSLAHFVQSVTEDLSTMSCEQTSSMHWPSLWDPTWASHPEIPYNNMAF